MLFLWFARVISISDHVKIKKYNRILCELEVLWLQRHNNTKYYYLEDCTDMISLQSVICTGVEFEPVFEDSLVWELLTPMAFIRALETTEEPEMLLPLTTVSTATKLRAFDITNLVFNNIQEFQDFLYKYN